MDSLDLSKLSNDYQVLTELHRTATSTTYLARHLKLNRDVTVTAVRAVGDRTYLTQFASDIGILSIQRHPNVVPVIEGRWLSDDTFAVVHARVRGSTLDQLTSAVGPMPVAKIESTLREVTAALVWARANGIQHRAVSPDNLVFQQGSGRALLAFDPSPTPVTDERTIESLAAMMSQGTPVNTAEFMTMLAPGAPVVAPASGVTVRGTPLGIPVSEAPVVVPVKRGMGFTARVLTAFAVIAALVILGVMFMQRRAPARQVANSQLAADSRGEAAGDVALHSGHPATQPAPETVYPTPTIIDSRPSQPASPPPAYVPPVDMPSPSNAAPMRPMPQMPTRENRRAFPTSPPAADPGRTTGDVCDSPASGDQHRCLMDAVERNDQPLNALYNRVIAALRRQADAQDGDPDPESVTNLRAAERRWLQDRDDACHGVGSGPLYARDRAACFAERSAARMRELEQMLNDASSLAPLPRR